MDAFTNFLADNYVWFLLITLIMLFALIGYLVDLKEIKSGKVKKTKDDDLKIIDFSTVDQTKSLNDSIKEEGTNSLNLDEYAKKSKGDEFISADKLQNMNFESTTPLADAENNLLNSVITDNENEIVNDDVNNNIENMEEQSQEVTDGQGKKEK